MMTSTTTTEISEFAEGLFGLALDGNTMAAVQADVSSMGMNPFLNAIYTQVFGTVSSATMAQTIVTNLGMTNNTDAQFVTGLIQTALDAASLSNTQGETAMNILNLFAGLTSDATWGSSATAWMHEISNAEAYSQDSAYTAPVSINNIPITGPITTGGTALDISGYTGIHDLSSTTPAVSTLNITSASATASMLNLAPIVTINDSSNSDIYNPSVLTLTHAGSGTDSLIVNFASPAVEAITSTGDTSVTLNLGAGISGDLVIHETDNLLTTIKITGGGGFQFYTASTNYSTNFTDYGVTIPSGTTVASSLKTIDASGLAGGCEIDAGATANGVSYSGLTIYGGQSYSQITNEADNGSIVVGSELNGGGYNPSYAVTALSANINDSASHGSDYLALGGNNDSASLGVGASTIDVNGNNCTVSSVVRTSSTSGLQTINLNGISETVTLGAGSTTVVIPDGSQSGQWGVTATSSFSDKVSIGTGPVTVWDSLSAGAYGINTLELSGNLNNASVYFYAGISPTHLYSANESNASSLVAAIQSQEGNGLVWFQYNGYTYLENTLPNSWVTSGGTPPPASSDYQSWDLQLVKLSGTVDLTHATVNGGTVYL